LTGRRYLRLYSRFARNNFARELEFRGNFFAKIFVNVSWLVGYVLFLQIIFRNTASVAGWSQGEMFVLFGTYLIARSLMDLFFSPNLTKIPELIRLGTMDFVLTKPIGSQFHVSTRYLSLDEIGTLGGALLILAYGAHLAHLTPSLAQFAIWLLLVACGVAILYAIQLTLMTLSFWLVKVDNLSALVGTITDAGRYPTNIFHGILRHFLTFVIPLAFIAYIPTLVLKEHIRPDWIAAALAVTTVFVGLASLFWRRATQSYTSASS